MKAIGGILAVLALIYLGLCFVGPEKIAASRSTEIEAPASSIFANVSNFKNWEKWMPWYKDNPDMKLNFESQTAGVGAGYSWESTSAGNGSMKILEAVAGKYMKTQIDFEGMGTSYGSWDFVKVENGKTKVTWGMDSPDSVPFLMRGFMKLAGVQGKINEDFDRGLASLKKVVETHISNLPNSYDGYEIKNIDLPKKHYIGMRKEIEMQDLQPFYTSSFGAAVGAAAANKLEMTGMPTGCFYSWDEKTGKTDLLAGVPVNTAPRALTGGLTSITLPAGKALEIAYFGNFSGSVKAHEAIAKYMSDRGLESTNPVMEEYVTDPSMESDTSKWLTKVTYRFSKN